MKQHDLRRFRERLGRFFEQRERATVLRFEDRRFHVCGKRQHIGRDGFAGLSAAFGSKQLAQIARETARRGNRIARARADDFRAAVRIEHRRIDAPILADAIRFGSNHDRGAGCRTQLRDARVRTRATAASVVSSGTTA